MPILTDISTLYTCKLDGGQDEVHPIIDAAIAWEGETIQWVGPASNVPAELNGDTRYSADGQVVVPGLVDCHTHLGFWGWRENEFEQRIKGAGYVEIAETGGGINKTMRQTREATSEDLTTHCLGVLEEMAGLGVTTVECKSGYGLSVEAELRLLRIYKSLKELQPVGLISTFLGAHVIPPEYSDDRGGYVSLLCDTLIPEIQADDLATFCDVFVEEGAFSGEEAEIILRSAQNAGMKSKLHVDQLSDGGGGALAARLGAISADHLEYTSSSGMDAMADAGVVGVCLPFASLYLNQQPMSGRAFIKAGVRLAVATDFNPGSAPSYHLPLAMMLACTMSRLTPAEALKGATIHAALALGLQGSVGSIEDGKRADFAVLDVSDVNHWLYHFRSNACTQTYIGGIPQD
ncbi:MAG: imidazolonepropionase [Rhodothermia bacterium]|nr:MAG: imidazolonepropionase [Rhodothermia bacterium]